MHNVISFTQTKWMEPYIIGNDNLRTQASIDKHKFLVEFFKLMNNSVFGKTMENVRRHMNLQLTTDHAKTKL